MAGGQSALTLQSQFWTLQGQFPAPPQASCQACPVRSLLEPQAQGQPAPLVWVSQPCGFTDP